MHGDYHLGNALVGRDGDMRAVLDWELCTVGDPLADVGLMVAYWSGDGRGRARERTPCSPSPSPRCPASRGAAGARGAYVRASGRDPAALGFWVAFAYWKVAIIVEGVYRRWLNDPANGSDAGRLQPAGLASRHASRLEAAADETNWSELGSGRSER